MTPGVAFAITGREGGLSQRLSGARPNHHVDRFRNECEAIESGPR
jgi:riboflavin biosynthesis pyrimidine reductase